MSTAASPPGPSSDVPTEPPAGPRLESALRRAVIIHGRSERRRVYPPVLHAGDPHVAETIRSLAVGPPLLLDHTLRVEIVQAMVRDLVDLDPPPLLWLTRPLRRPESDLVWQVAARDAGIELGRTLRLYAVSKQSWSDPLHGGGRTWQRPIRRG